MYVYLVMVLIHICTPATGTFTAIDISLSSPDILMEIDFMVESDSYDSDHFPIILKIGVSLPDSILR